MSGSCFPISWSQVESRRRDDCESLFTAPAGSKGDVQFCLELLWETVAAMEPMGEDSDEVFASLASMQAASDKIWKKTSFHIEQRRRSARVKRKVTETEE